MMKFMNTKSAIKRFKKRGETVRSLPMRRIIMYSSAITFALPLVIQYPELLQKLAVVPQSMASTGITKQETGLA
jgi:hypothetical protein